MSGRNTFKLLRKSWPLRIHAIRKIFAEPDSFAQQVLEMSAVSERGVMTVVQLNYKYKPRPRFGHGNPEHRELHEIFASHEDAYQRFLKSLLKYAKEFAAIPVDASSTTPVDTPIWNNPWFPSLDAASLYGMLTSHNPQQYVEIGSGNSTKFARRTIKDQKLRTKILSIDPNPRSEIDHICDEILRLPLEDIDVALFDTLEDGDFLFIDSSHRAFQNSDVTIFFTEILPILKPGVVIHLHDIFLPWDYPAKWANRYYNEQYLLACYLLGGETLEIMLANAFISVRPEFYSILAPIWDQPTLSGVVGRGGSFWARKV